MVKAERGTKRVCRECGGKFYDLNRDPVVCPLCGAAYMGEEPAARSSPPAQKKQETEQAEAESEATGAAAGGEGPEIVSLEDVKAEESGDDSGVEEEEVIDLEEEEEKNDNLPDTSNDDTFLEEDDDGNSDVSDIISTKMGSEADEA